MHRFLAFLIFTGGHVLSTRAQVDGALRWSFTTLSSTTPGAIPGSPALAPDGTVYFGVQVGTTKADAGGRVIALSPAGELKWAATLPDWVDTTPAVADDGTVYVSCWDGKLHAFAPDGAKQWEYVAGGYIASSPAVSGDGTIYVGAGDFNVHAVNPDGTLKWLYPTADWVDGSPSIGVDGTIYVGAGRQLYAVGPDGVGRWQAALTGGIVGAPAIAADGAVYIGSRDKRVYAFAAGGQLLWAFETGDAVEASPVIAADGTIYVGSLDGRLYALNRDGSEKWRFPRANDPALGAIYSTAAVRADGAVVFGASDSGVYAVSADGRLLWKTAIGDWADSSPVIAGDGTIYLGCYDKKLYSLAGTSGPANSDWPMLRRDAARTSWQPRGLPGGGSGRLVNTSVRSRVAADGPLTVGFSVAGDGERTLLVRGVGPALAQFGLPDALPDPRLRIMTADSLRPIAENSSWSERSDVSEIMRRSAEAGAFPLPNPSRDAAALQSFPPGSYTATIESHSGRRGVVLAEIYNTGGSAARMVNLSVRATVAGADGVLTAGVVVADGRRSLLIRGVGPTLSRFGVTNAMADPRLRLFDGGDRPAVENDNWHAAPNATAVAAAAMAIGAFPLETFGRDAALLVQVEPGSYTVQLSGAGGLADTALLEIYELP